MNRLGLALSLLAAAASNPAAGAEIVGRYATPADAGVPQAVEVTPRRQACTVVVEPVAGQRKRHGWGLRDGDQLGVAFATGGAAYGVAIYHHDSAAHRWNGRWITSLDGGATVGVIRFDDGGALEGRHALTCERPGAGEVSGSVDIQAAADGYRLTFRLGRAVYYRGVGVPLDGDRLVVSWSFGSAPELGIFTAGADSSLTEKRVAWNGPAGPAASVKLVPVQASSELPPFTDAPGPDTPTFGPAAPRVKIWNYAVLMQRYGQDGWAERWLEVQLTPEELQLLHEALQRPATPGTESIAALIEAERTREAKQ